MLVLLGAPSRGEKGRTQPNRVSPKLHPSPLLYFTADPRLIIVPEKVVFATVSDKLGLAVPLFGNKSFKSVTVVALDDDAVDVAVDVEAEPETTGAIVVVL